MKRALQFIHSKKKAELGTERFQNGMNLRRLYILYKKLLTSLRFQLKIYLSNNCSVTDMMSHKKDFERRRWWGRNSNILLISSLGVKLDNP